ncbi:fascin domain-containing protein [Saccharothrix obliqua]|uniref:fascin domain-containing protein n=1 Tax=Saccharothrix obliqua TaxID=2861747 RepID=UPI001C5D8C1E|nr:hypothetical protein [Saccharothrix obliqua]MBW4722158.1 hypothetical protein [Saccharothrix obliqua]
MRLALKLSATLIAAVTAFGLAQPAAAATSAVPAGWQLVKGSDVRVAAQYLYSAASGRYVSAELDYPGGNNGLLRARSTVADAWEQFTFAYDAAAGKWSIKSIANDRYVSAELDYSGGYRGVLRARATAVDLWEQFDLFYSADEERYALRAANGSFVSAELQYTGGYTNVLRARAGAIDAWEKFIIG